MKQAVIRVLRYDSMHFKTVASNDKLEIQTPVLQDILDNRYIQVPNNNRKTT